MKSSLYLAVQSIEPSGLSFETEEKPEIFPVVAELIHTGECRFTDSIRIAGTAHRIQDLFKVTGTVRTGIRLSCSRCLNDVEASLSEKFSLTFSREVPQADPVAEPSEKELTVDEFGLIYFSGEQIDLHESIQEQIVMMLPQRPLCSESCKGLCPHCGADLNRGECGCRQPVLDDRLAILKNLIIKTDDD